ncbi:MAG TPA: tetratricopeptide repeat protein [Planctomycetota bacterium]|nr:tetratricopeptide repeat protein [Planctomycetota bacterium]
MMIQSPVIAQDKVKLRSGTVDEGRIVAEEYDVLLFKTKKGKEEKDVKLKWDDITDVTYGAPEYHQAVNQLTNGNYAAAVSRLEGLAGSASFRKELKPLVVFQLAQAQQRMGKFTEAATALQQLVKENPKSRYIVLAAQGITDCYVALGDPATGTTAIEALSKAATDGGVDALFLAVFDYFRGRLKEAQKDLVGAKVKYQAAAAARGAPASWTAMAKLGLARCEHAEGRSEQARDAYRVLIDLPDVGNEVLAGAWNGLADIVFQDAMKAKNAEQLTNALLMYLRGVVEYGPAPGEGTSEYERSLASAGRVFQQLSELGTDDASKKQNQQRAKQRLDQLRKEFPSSIYLKS